MDRGNVQHLLDPVSVIQQTIVSRIGDNRMNWPLRLRGFRHLTRNAVAGKFTLRNTAKNTERIARRLQPERHHIAHHQQMRQRFMAITINK